MGSGNSQKTSNAKAKNKVTSSKGKFIKPKSGKSAKTKTTKLKSGLKSLTKPKKSKSFVTKLKQKPTKKLKKKLKRR